MPSIATRSSWVDDDRRELDIRGLEHDVASATFEALDRHLVVQARHHDLPRMRVARLVHREQVAVENADVLHAGAAHAQEIVRPRSEEFGIDPEMRFDMLGRKDWTACRDATDEGQRALHRHARNILESQASRGAGHELDRTFFRQRLQVIFRRAGSGKSQPRGDLGARWRHPASLHEASNPVEDLPLARRESRRQWVRTIRRASQKRAFFGISATSAIGVREHPGTH